MFTTTLTKCSLIPYYLGIIAITLGMTSSAPAARAPTLPGFFKSSPNSQQTTEAHFWRRAVMGEAQILNQKNYVPYVWGGARVGNEAVCERCRSCIRSTQVALKERAQHCHDCRICGADCSHFVGLVFRRAGLPYDFVTTWELGRVSEDQARQWYNLVLTHDRQQTFSGIEAGDVLLHPKHMTMVIRPKAETTADIIEMTRFARSDGIGGIRIVEDVDLTKYRGGVRRVFRHVLLHHPEPKSTLSTH